MAEKATKNNKNLIIGICSAIAAIVIIVIIALVAANGGNKQINDNYFVSDDTKYVLTLGADYIDSSDEYAPLKSHMVYYYSGDKITGLKVYYEYSNADNAKTAYEALKELNDSEPNFKDILIDGKYVILVSNESDYESLTASEVKQQIDFMKSLQDLDVDDTDDYDYEIEEDTEEEVEE